MSLSTEEKDTLDKIVRVFIHKPPIMINGKRFEITEEQYETVIGGTETQKRNLVEFFNSQLELTN